MKSEELDITTASPSVKETCDLAMGRVASKRASESELFTIYDLPFSVLGGAPGAIPTRDLPLRRRTLYATELRERELVNRKS